MEKVVFKAYLILNTILHNCSSILYYLFAYFYRDKSRTSPVFIVGAPRTGSTVLYQAITNDYHTCYIDNLTSKFYGFLPLGKLISWLVYKSQPHNSFDSIHGDTSVAGARGPSECGDFWYRWLPRSDHYVDAGYLRGDAKESIRNEIELCSAICGETFIIKNLNAGLRLKLISEIFPSARIIWCRRDLRYVANSICGARRKLNIDDSQFWSVKPRNWRQLSELPMVEQVCSQVFYIEQSIKEDLSLFRTEDIWEVSYEEFTVNPGGIVQALGDELGLKKREFSSEIKISSQAGKVTDKELFNEIEREITKLFERC